MSGETNHDLTDYATLVSACLDGEVQPQEFVRMYQDKFKSDTRIFAEEVFLVLDGIFGTAEVLTYDLGLLERHQETHIDERKFFEELAAAAEKLRVFL